MDDIDLRNMKLKKFHTWLEATVPGYIALCEAGSTTAGDAWVDGRSDRDITIVVEELTAVIEDMVSEYLRDSDFTDTYLFILFSRVDFMATASDQDISMKFRGETLFGKDLVAEKEAPSREFAREVGIKGLSSMSRKFRTRLMNSGYWSNDHLKDEVYKEFKHFIMYLADLMYAKTGAYPRRRQDVARAYDSPELKVIVDVLANFAHAPKEDVIQAMRAARDFQSNASNQLFR